MVAQKIRIYATVYRDYFGDNPERLVDCIKKYKQLKGSHKNDEGYLADLLK